MTARGLKPGDVVGLLDVGTAKVCCAIVGVEPPQGPAMPAARPPVRVLGFSHCRSNGIKSGIVIDLEQAEQSIRQAISKAEAQAGVTVERVVLAASCGRIKSSTLQASAPVAGQAVTQADIQRVLSAGLSYAERERRVAIHLGQIGWRLDGMGSVMDPIGMRGQTLEADLLAVTADEAPSRNLLIAVERADVSVAAIVPGPLASALSATTQEERRLGVTVIDIGAGATTVGLFAEGHFLQADALAIGGAHVSFDIARALSTPLAEAERIKTLYGSMMGALSDEHEMVRYPAADADEGAHDVSKAALREIVRPRMEELLHLIGERLDRNKLAGFAAGRVVLTGGASQLQGLAEWAAHRLRRPVRVGMPQPLPGLSASLCNPSYAAVFGLAHSLFVRDACLPIRREWSGGRGQAGYLERVGQWFAESF